MDLNQNHLFQIANQLTQVLIPIVIVVSTLSNSLNIVVLTRPTLYQEACSRYFIAHAVGNLFYSNVILIYRLLADQYQINPAKISNIWCKIILYITHVGIFLAPFFIVLASIDRWCVSSRNARLRRFSNVSNAQRMIVITIILFALVFINTAITADLQYTDPFGCSIRADTIYKIVYVFIQVSIVSFIPPILMTFFGLMTIYNIKKAHIAPVTMSHNRRRTENQIARMLFLQIGTYVILNIPSSVTYLIFVLPNDLKNTPGFLFASLLSVLPLHVSYTTAFFLYILSGRIYRQELIKLGTRIFRCNNNVQVRPFIENTNTIPTVHFRHALEHHDP